MTHLIEQGGPFIMYPILIIFIVIDILFVKALISKKNPQKSIALISSISLFVLAWGVLGQVFGLIDAFDAIDGDKEATIGHLARGLKFTFLPVVFGLITFLAGRFGIIVLQWKKQQTINNK